MRARPCSPGSSPTSGTSRASTRTADGVRLTVESPLARELAEGDSVAVNGVCLTAVGICGERFGADVMHETLRRSSLGEVAEGSRVNLELALRADARLGGHMVQGHVDGVGAVAGVREDGFARLVTIAAAPELLRYVVEKGSIAVDGVSLTVAEVVGRRVRRLADPRDARPHQPRHRDPRHAGQPGGGHPGQVRREAGGGPMTDVRTRSPFATVEQAIEDIRAGRMVVVCDDEDRENEGDLTMAAQFATPEQINFMAKEARGLDLPGAHARALRRARPGPHGGQERVALRDGVHGVDRGPRGRHDGHLGRRPRAHDPGGHRPRRARRATSSSPGTCSR